MKFRNYCVRYWDHPSFKDGGRINDCYGNSHALEIKARSEGEAIRKAEKKVSGIFRLFRAELLTK